MKFNPITGLIVLAVLVAWGVVIFGSNDRPDVLPAMVGCAVANQDWCVR
jgi:hypothetical protein